jgi:adenosylcobinamide-GDP ribazoletransferase
MSSVGYLRRAWSDFLSAVQFLTRVHVPPQPYEPDTLSRAVKFFPVVGLLIGAGAALLHFLLTPHLPALIVALLIVVYLVAITGCLHEDGLADAADGFGGGWGREKVLSIMRDSRIGSYGAAALTLSLIARILLIASLSPIRAGACLIAAHVLCRWTTLPLSFYLPPARDRSDEEIDGQGARIAGLTTSGALVFGSLFAFGAVAVILRRRALVPVFISIVTTLLTALYYKRRIGGVTGDCFGATNQLTEIVVYLCGVWA